jgi:hypothetical protein
MYGVEAAVILLACLFSLGVLWTAPLWMRVLAGLISSFSRQIDRADKTTEKDLIYPKEEK